jgi:hypothetical protein
MREEGGEHGVAHFLTLILKIELAAYRIRR